MNRQSCLLRHLAALDHRLNLLTLVDPVQCLLVRALKAEQNKAEARLLHQLILFIGKL